MTNFDNLEQRDATTRQAEQLTALKLQIAHAKANTNYFATSLKDVADISSLDDLQKLPVIHKSDLLDLQTLQAPFAGMNALPIDEMKNIFISPGPIAEPMGRAENEHRLARAMAAADITKQDRVLNCFSYHHTPAGLMFEGGAVKVGCPVYPGGIGQRDDQIKAIQSFGLTAYVGTPDFLKLIIEKALENDQDISSIKKGLVSGGPFFPVLKEFYQKHNIDVKECYATADLGLIAYQDTEAGLVIDEDIIVEIVTPGTGNALPDGEIGEVIVTLLTNKAYPLIRFATGDLSMVLPAVKGAKNTNKRLKGWLGRADQTCKVKGMFVHPKQIAEIVQSLDILSKAKMIINNKDGQDVVVLSCEIKGEISDEISHKIIENTKNITKISVNIEISQLPNDGLVIEDKRVFD